MIKYITIALAFALVASCGNPQKQDGPNETATSGSCSIQVDSEVLELIATAKVLYEEQFPNAKIALEPMSAQDIVSLLLRHDIRGAIVARGYTAEEDTAVIGREGSYGFPKTLLARDALVLVANKEFPYDTMYAPHIVELLQGKVSTLSNYPNLGKKLSFVVPSSTSSVFGNVVNVVLKGSLPSKSVLFSAGSSDSVKQLVKDSKHVLGFAYLSQYVKDTTVKLIKLSYRDENGFYERPKPVHASYLIMGKYPFPVDIYYILRDKAKINSLPTGFMQFLARDAKAQRSFLDSGIEPGYAKIELVLPE